MAEVTDSLTMADISAGLQDYVSTNQEEVIADVFEIGFGGAPNSPIVPLSDYVNVLPASGKTILTDLVTGDPLQPGDKGSFDPKDDYARLKTREAEPHPVKVDLLFKEQKIRALYKTYMAKVRNKKYDPKVMPFEEWLLKKLNVDVQKYLRLAMFTAVTNQAAGTTSEDLFDGFVEIISDFLVEDPIKTNTVDLDVKLSLLTIDNCVDVFELMADALPANFAYGEEAVLLVSKAHRDLYNKAYRKKYGTVSYNSQFERMNIDGTNVEIIVEEGVTEFARPVITTRENFVFLYDDSNPSIQFDYQVRDRSLAYVMDFKAGVGVCASERIWTGVWTAEE